MLTILILVGIGFFLRWLSKKLMKLSRWLHSFSDTAKDVKTVNKVRSIKMILQHNKIAEDALQNIKGDLNAHQYNVRAEIDYLEKEINSQPRS